MFFDIQRFDGSTTEADKWTVLTEYNETHYTETNASTSNATVFWGFVPAGTSYTEGNTIQFSGSGGSSVTKKLYVFEKNAVTLKINMAGRINNCIDYTALGDNANKHGVSGNATRITLALNSGQSVSDLVVEGANKEALEIMIDDTVYNVYHDGSVDTVAPYGLLSRVDKHKLSNLDSDVTSLLADVSQLQQQMSNAIVGGEMTAAGFVLRTYQGTGAATISSVGLDAETAAATYATKEEMREYVRQVIASDTGYTFINGSGTTVAQIPIMQ